MSITRGITERPVPETTEGVGRWINVELIPLLKELRAGINALTSLPPSGAAGGDLAGTYPDPDVAAVHETGGPTRLPMGPVAEGEFFKRVSGRVEGATITSTAPVTLRGHRHEDQGGAFVSGTSRIHWVGLNAFSSTGAHTGGGLTSALQSIGTGQMAYAYGDYAERAIVINRLIIRTNGRVGTVGAPRVKFMVYAEGSLTSGSFAGSPYPGVLLGESGNLDIDQGGANKIVEAFGLSIPIPAGTRWWGVWLCNDQAVTNQYTVPAYRSGALLPILGFTLDPVSPTTIATDDASRGVGWRHAIAYTGTEAAPNPFPQTAPAVLTGADLVLPAVGFGQVIT